MPSAVKRSGRPPADAYRFRHVLRACGAGSVSGAARELLAESWFVSRAAPPSVVRAAAALLTVAFTLGMLLASASPSLGPWPTLHTWLHRHFSLVLFGLSIGWMVVYWLALEFSCLAANTFLLIGHSLSFPIRLVVRSVRRLVGCRRVVAGSLQVLGRWLPPDDVIAVCGKIMPRLPTADAIAWDRLTPGQTVSRCLEVQSGEWLKDLPVRVWPELVTPDLSPLAMANLFGRCLRGDGNAIRPVSSAIIAQGWFALPERAPRLVRELVALPPERLAAALDMLSELSLPQRGLTTRCVLDGVQKLGDTGSIQRVQSAIAYLAAETCEAALARS
jgi:hypothetical protein